jgi:aminoglycoside N3'-acetyltransferase
MKHGKAYNELPVRKLSQAFSLDMVGGRAVTTKQTLLGSIEEIVSSHRPLKRSNDSQFKAFVCLALNQKKLVSWLHLLLRSASMIEHYYQPWSYVIKTGADDTLHTLDRLTKLHFTLPVDLAIRPFNNINDAF